jgi:hypothetical protein
VLGFDAARNRAELGARLLERHAVRETAYRAPIVRGSGLPYGQSSAGVQTSAPSG